jgi:hypothetical protein
MLADFNLLQANYPYAQKINSLWSKLSFPLFYHADILFVLRVAKELDALDQPQAQRAMEWLRSQRNRNGTWRGAAPSPRTWPLLAQGDNINRGSPCTQ